MSAQALTGFGAGYALSNERDCDAPWTVLRCCAGRESAALSHLVSRGIESYIPTWTRHTKRAPYGSRPIQCALFPGYAFIRPADQAERKLALDAPHVICSLRSDGLDAALPHSDIERIRLMCSTELARPHPLLKEGMPVTISAGPLTGVEGIILSLDNSYHLVVNVDILGRATG